MYDGGMRRSDRRVPPDPSPEAAFTAGLVLLGRRELSSRQVADRLRRKGFPENAVALAVERLQANGALDDSRTAHAQARHAVVINRHGRARVLRKVQSLGVDDEIARAAVAATFDELNEEQLLSEALTRKLRGQPLPTDRSSLRRLYGWLVRQGFDAGRIQTALRSRRK
jgi:regulatory protein